MTIQHKKVGGIRFVKIGRMQMSFCITKAQPSARKPCADLLALDGLIAIVFFAAFAFITF